MFLVNSVFKFFIVELRPERRMMLVMFLSLLIPVIGSLETAANLICAQEFENKTLIWLERSTSRTGDVESRAWYKDNTLVSWINEKGFREGPGYEGRLKHVGDGNIKIRNVTRIDSGNYKQISRFQGVSNTFEASVNLQVIDAPARTCKPVISHEGSNLKAYLPSDDVCTTLRPEWKDNKTVTTQNGTSILDLGTDSGEREYIVCAVGESTKCFQGNMSDFCTHYTVPQHKQSVDGGTLPLAVGIPSLVIVILILAISGIFWMRHKGIICQKFHFSEFRDYLKKCYGTMTDVSVSPVDEIIVSVSMVFASLKVERIEIRDTEDTNTATECDLLVSKEDTDNLMTQSKSFPPIMIVGDSGSDTASSTIN